MKHNLTVRRGAIGATAGLAMLGVAGVCAPAHAATIPTVLAKIRYCESGNNYQAQNPSSSASGAYQFLTSTWQSLSAAKGYATAAQAPAAVQDAAALELYNQAGTAPWAASQACWSALGAVPSTGSTSTSSSTSSTTSTTSSTTGGSAASTGNSSTRGSAPDRQKPPAKAPRPKGVNPPPAQKVDHDRVAHGKQKNDCKPPAPKGGANAGPRHTAAA